MGYNLKLFIYYLNSIAVFAAAVWLVYSIVMIFVNNDNITNNFFDIAIYAVAFLLLFILNIVRKSKIPAAGKDYK